MTETISKLNPAQQLLFWSVVGTAVLSLGNLLLLAALVVLKRREGRTAGETLDATRELLAVNRKWTEYATHKTEQVRRAADEVKQSSKQFAQAVASAAQPPSHHDLPAQNPETPR